MDRIDWLFLYIVFVFSLNRNTTKFFDTLANKNVFCRDDLLKVWKEEPKCKSLYTTI